MTHLVGNRSLAGTATRVTGDLSFPSSSQRGSARARVRRGQLNSVNGAVLERTVTEPLDFNRAC